jgi:hypothetical protein
MWPLRALNDAKLNGRKTSNISFYNFPMKTVQKGDPEVTKSYLKIHEKSDLNFRKNMHSVYEVCTFLVRPLDGLGVVPPALKFNLKCHIFFFQLGPLGTLSPANGSL